MTGQYIAPGVHISYADNRWLRKRYLRCPMCECITEMVQRHEPWYGVTTYCCRCGDWWQEGELSSRPFERGWRKKNIRHHRELWNQAKFGPDPKGEEMYPDMLSCPYHEGASQSFEDCTCPGGAS